MDEPHWMLLPLSWYYSCRTKDRPIKSTSYQDIMSGTYRGLSHRPFEIAPPHARWFSADILAKYRRIIRRYLISSPSIKHQLLACSPQARHMFIGVSPMLTTKFHRLPCRSAALHLNLSVYGGSLDGGGSMGQPALRHTATALVSSTALITGSHPV